VSAGGGGFGGGPCPTLAERFGRGGGGDRGGSGLGLALSIARRLGALHGGSLSVESAAGQGAPSRLFAPAPPQEGAPSFATIAAPAQLPLGGVRVLLVPEDRTAGQLLAGGARPARGGRGPARAP